MAASCLGAFGSYKLQYSRYLKDRLERERQQAPVSTETVWVTKRYAPTDERVIAPVPRRKHLVSARAGNFDNSREVHWIPVTDPPLASFNRASGPPLDVIYVSHQATRSEDWSTLRQMLPSYGNVWRVDQPNWGTASGPPPTPLPRVTPRLPHINSCMTKYTDDMHKTHRQFKHC